MNQNFSNTMALMTQDPAAIAAAEGAKARIQSAYIMALNKPRNEDEARVRILQACKRPAFAERVEYSKPVAGKSIRGPSIRFAELALREWQNILADTQTLYEDDKIRRVRVSVLDLETNAQFSKEIQVRKTVERKKAEGREIAGERTNTNGEQVFIVYATDDELQNKEAALISKALRNEGLRIIPSDIIDEALDTARKTLRTRDATDPKAAKNRILDAFASLGIKPKEIEKYLQHSLDSVSPAEIESLRGVYTAIKEGDASWADYSNPKQSEPEEGDRDADEKSLKQFKEWIDGRSDVKVEDAMVFIKANAQHFNKSETEFMKGAMAPEDQEAFISGLKTYIAKAPLKRSDFINLKEKGFKPWLLDLGKEKYDALPEDLKKEIRDKWNGMKEKKYADYQGPFPYDEKQVEIHDEEESTVGREPIDAEFTSFGENPMTFQKEMVHYMRELGPHFKTIMDEYGYKGAIDIPVDKRQKLLEELQTKLDEINSGGE